MATKHTADYKDIPHPRDLYKWSLQINEDKEQHKLQPNIVSIAIH